MSYNNLTLSLKRRLLAVLCLFLGTAGSLAAQEDVVMPRGGKPAEEADKSFTIDAYIDTYMRLSSDSLAKTEGEKFETVGPRANQIGVNIARLSGNYESDRLRGTMSLFWGDIPEYSWDRTYPMLQEAHAGVRVAGNLWLDMGFFPTHVGTEVLLPRDNLMSSLALGTFHEPFYMSAATASWEGEKFTARAVYATSYYSFTDEIITAEDNAYGLFLGYSITDNLSINYSNLFDNMASSQADTSQWRHYHNAYVSYTGEQLSFQVGGDFAMQENSAFDDEGDLEDAVAYNFLVAAKYRFSPKGALFARYDYFTDEDGMLSATIDVEEDGKTVAQGLIANSITLGGEYNPSENSYIRLEGRLTTADKDQKWFYQDGEATNQRLAVLLTAGISFNSGNLFTMFK